MNRDDMTAAIRHAGTVLIIAMSARIVAQAIYDMTDQIAVQNIILRGMQGTMESMQAIAQHEQTMGMELIHELLHEGNDNDNETVEDPTDG